MHPHAAGPQLSCELAPRGCSHAHPGCGAVHPGRTPPVRLQVLCTQRKWREALPMLQQAHRVLGGALDAQHPNLLAVGRFLSHCTERALPH